MFLIILLKVNAKIFFFLDQTDAEGKDGEGECGTGSGRGQHHRPAGKHTHPRPV